MIDLTRNRRKIFAFTGLFVLLLAAVLLLLPPEISPALGGGVGLEYRIHAVFNDEEEQQLAESSLIQTASDTLGSLWRVPWSVLGPGEPVAAPAAAGPHRRDPI